MATYLKPMAQIVESTGSFCFADVVTVFAVVYGHHIMLILMLIHIHRVFSIIILLGYFGNAV